MSIQHFQPLSSLRRLSALLILTLLLTACAPVAPSTDTTAPAESAAETIAATPQGVLREATQVPFRNWDAHQEIRPGGMIYFQPVYETLLVLQPDGTLAPGLATEWTHTAEAVELTLREGVTFHDGTPFDAEAVRANLLRVKTEGAPLWQGLLTQMSDVEVIDATHVRIILERPNPVMAHYLADMAGMMMSPAAFATITETPVGTGGYQLNSDETVLEQRYVYDRNESYWNPAVQGLAQVELLLVPQMPARIAALIAGEIDVTNAFPDRIAELEGAGMKVLINENSSVMTLNIIDLGGQLVPAFADERVRRALSHAIDRAALAETLERGVSKVTTQRYLEGQYGHSAEIEDLNYDPEKAKALLAEAGVTGLTFAAPAAPATLAYNQAIAGFLAEVGVTMNIAEVAGNALAGEVAEGKFPVYVADTPDYHPALYFASRMAPQAANNPFGFQDEELSKLAQQARALPAAEAEPLWAEICRKMAERGYVIHLNTYAQIMAVSPRVQGAALNGLGGNSLQSVLGLTVTE